MIWKYTIICLMALIALFFIHLLIIKLNYADDSVSPRNRKWSSRGSNTKTGLYSSEDKVTELTTFNFNENVYNSSSAWVVQFYNSWCGHCIKFSPIWKELAADIYSWRDVVVIAAIDCADDLNTQHCRDYEIMGYPTIRFFRPHTVNVTNGEEFARGDDEVSALRHTVITKLEATEKVVMPSKWPDLLLVPDKDALWTDQGKQLLLFWNDPSKRVVLLVIENEASFAGSELILDLKDVPSVTVKRVLDSSAGGAADPKVASIQVFAFFRPEVGQERPSAPKPVAIDAGNRQSIFDSVRRYLRTLAIDVPDIFSEHYAPKQPKQKQQQQSEAQLRLVNTVYVDDLNMALRYSLFHEIPLQSNIMGEKMQALRRYIDVLNRFYPFDDVTRQFLLTVARELPAYERMSGRDFKKLVRNHGNQFENVQRQWVACKGTDSTLRGYPCGLWTLFHTLTVRELKVLEQVGQTTTAPEVLSAMAAYIKNFFGCADCAEHFTEMARTIAGNVTTPVDSVLWLWRAHNKVNARLAGDGSEDPGFPKVQFPVKELCPECRHTDGSWNELKVLDYLVRMFWNLQRVDYTNAEHAEPLQSDEGERKVSASSTGWNLGLVDMRTCIGLYVLCACLLTVYTLRFFVKRNPRSNRSSKYEFTMKALSHRERIHDQHCCHVCALEKTEATIDGLAAAAARLANHLSYAIPSIMKLVAAVITQNETMMTIDGQPPIAACVL